MQRETVATDRLVQFIHKTSFDDLPAQVVQDTKRVICDSLGCAIGAHHIEPAKIVVEMATEWGGPPQSSILGTGQRVSPAAAAFANAYLGNVLDADDTLLNFSHPAVSPVFAALAITESLGRTGKDLITAVALGYEVGSRVGASLVFIREKSAGHFESSGNPLSWYGFSAAGAAGKAMGLSAEQFVNAFGVAGWTASINSADLYSRNVHGKHMLKYAPVGFITMNGLIAAKLAQKGFTGDKAIFDSSTEYWTALGALDCNRERMLDGLGEKWLISETSLKPYASCRFTHPSIGLVKQIMTAHKLRADEIEKVEVQTFERGVDPWLSANRNPQTQIDAQFSFPLAIAAVALGSDLGPQWQSRENLANPQLLTLAQKVSVSQNPESGPVLLAQLLQEGRFKRNPNRVSISARGRVFSESCDMTSGDPWREDTRMSDTEVKQKFSRFSNGILASEKIDKSIDVLFNLERVHNVADELAPLLR